MRPGNEPPWESSPVAPRPRPLKASVPARKAGCHLPEAVDFRHRKWGPGPVRDRRLRPHTAAAQADRAAAHAERTSGGSPALRAVRARIDRCSRPPQHRRVAASCGHPRVMRRRIPNNAAPDAEPLVTFLTRRSAQRPHRAADTLKRSPRQLDRPAIEPAIRIAGARREHPDRSEVLEQRREPLGSAHDRRLPPSSSGVGRDLRAYTSARRALNASKSHSRQPPDNGSSGTSGCFSQQRVIAPPAGSVRRAE